MIKTIYNKCQTSCENKRNHKFFNLKI